MSDKCENLVVPMAKSCSDNLFQQVYFMKYMQDTIEETKVISNYLESKVISNDLQKYELGAGTNE